MLTHKAILTTIRNHLRRHCSYKLKCLLRDAALYDPTTESSKSSWVLVVRRTDHHCSIAMDVVEDRIEAVINGIVYFELANPKLLSIIKRFVDSHFLELEADL